MQRIQDAAAASSSATIGRLEQELTMVKTRLEAETSNGVHLQDQLQLMLDKLLS